MTTRFRVDIYDFACHDLPIKDRSGSSDPYVKANFDNFKVFHTPVIKKTLNPVWDFKLTFVYETQYRGKLHKKQFLVRVYDKDRFSKDDFIGMAKVDLHTIATGPIAHDLPLWDEEQRVGQITFKVRMQEIANCAIRVKELAVTNLPIVDNRPPSSYVMISTSTTKRMIPSPPLRFEANPVFTKLPELKIAATLYDLLHSQFAIQLFEEGDNTGRPYFTATFDVEQYSNYTGDEIKISEQIPINEFEMYTIEGTMYWVNFPLLTQMPKGVHTEEGILNGKLFNDYVEMPKIKCIPTLYQNRPSIYPFENQDAQEENVDGVQFMEQKGVEPVLEVVNPHAAEFANKASDLAASPYLEKIASRSKLNLPVQSPLPPDDPYLPQPQVLSSPPPRGAMSNPPPRVVVSSPPPRGRVSNPPPRGVVSNPPQRVVSNPPSRRIVSNPPPRVVSNPPPRGVVSNPPPRVVSNPPPRGVLSNPPPRVVSNPPPRGVVSNPPPRGIVSAPPYEANPEDEHRSRRQVEQKDDDDQLSASWYEDPHYDPGLPEGFEECFNQDGRAFYIDHFLKTTTWEAPMPLPLGWERMLDPERGLVFYVDHNTASTHWNHPTGDKPQKKNKKKKAKSKRSVSPAAARLRQ